LKLLHTADWHLRQAHLNLTLRGPDFLRAALSTVDLAIEHKLECIVACGDLLNEGRPSSSSIAELREIHEKAAAADLPVLCILGNHDFSEPSWYHQVSGGEAASVGVWVHAVPGINDITGKLVSFRGTVFVGLPPVEGMELHSAIARMGAEIPAGSEVVWLWHGAVRDFAGYPQERYASCEDITNWLNAVPVRSKAFLLGDLHITRYAVLPVASGPCTIGYPGATEVITRAEPLTHTATLIDLDKTVGTGMLEMYCLPVRHRPAVGWRVYNEESLMALKQELEQYAGQVPIVFVNYKPEVPGLFNLIQTVIDPNTHILRAAEMPEMDAATDGWVAFNAVAEELRSNSAFTALDALSACVPPTAPAFQLATALLRESNNAKASELIDIFVREQTAA
jgi:hypothetical protein